MIVYSYKETDDSFNVTFSGKFSEDDLNGALDQIADIALEHTKLVQDLKHSIRMNYFRVHFEPCWVASTCKSAERRLNRNKTMTHFFNTFGAKMGKGVMFSEFLNQHSRISD